MPTLEFETAAPALTPATWEEWERDWPPDTVARYRSQRFTRDELVDLMADAGTAPDGLPVAITANELRYLESIGVLPRPTREQGETGPRWVYPGWVVPVLVMLRVLQRRGMRAVDIGRWLRQNAAGIARDDIHPRVDTPSDAVVSARLRMELGRLARQYSRTTGIPAARIAVTITDAEGAEHTWQMPAPSPED